MTASSSVSNFTATRWTLVIKAQGDSPESRLALSELCAAYWNPVFLFLRREGRSDDLSRDLTQEFFARILARGGIGNPDPAKGRFRSYLLGALKHFLSDQRRLAGRLKRAGDAATDSLDAPPTDGSPPPQFPDPSAAFADKWFDREWALAIMDRSLSAVQSSFEQAGKGPQFEALKPWLVGDSENLSQSDAAASLGITNGAVKVAIHRLRKAFRSAVETEIAQTLPSSDDVASELAYLIEVLS
ncbi:MAG: RNA polymerase sigma-70 factor, ECF subfamily [Verrucomicrobia bacterium]|jgi:RNA polymerase sigma-70 factor (ECF subfamily)|nr:MAG: RNA polymerase sigma-70 factor, ECF subfamily [Verrucomicrobiota bacterium]